MKLKLGDTVQIDQKDGNTIILLVFEDGIGIKAGEFATLEVKRESSYFVTATAVDKPQ